MKVTYTPHARLQAFERSISFEEITHTLRYGNKVRGQANKTLLTDTMRNLCVVAVSQSKTRWLVITVYRTELKN